MHAKAKRVVQIRGQALLHDCCEDEEHARHVGPHGKHTTTSLLARNVDAPVLAALEGRRAGESELQRAVGGMEVLHKSGSSSSGFLSNGFSRVNKGCASVVGFAKALVVCLIANCVRFTTWTRCIAGHG
jgi:hypothetical protein